MGAFPHHHNPHNNSIFAPQTPPPMNSIIAANLRKYHGLIYKRGGDFVEKRDESKVQGDGMGWDGGRNGRMMLQVGQDGGRKEEGKA